MSELLFEWDGQKAEKNKLKHGISFEEAKAVFNDPFAITIPDPFHSEKEDRWADIGLAGNDKLLVVWYAERGDRIRLIGSRRATRRERRIYEGEEER